MYGTIEFPDEKSLSEFLKNFTGCTAMFEVTYNSGRYILKFTGGF